jgi:hypothetical protein
MPVVPVIPVRLTFPVWFVASAIVIMSRTGKHAG